MPLISPWAVINQETEAHKSLHSWWIPYEGEKEKRSERKTHQSKNKVTRTSQYYQNTTLTTPVLCFLTVHIKGSP
jgi:hypothetical protein